jgi:dCMP deaminase
MSLINKLNKLINDCTYRLSWDEYFMSTALLISSRSSCDRLHVGCILVKNNRIIASGYNGFLPSAPHESIIVNNHEQATIHAEQNAVTDCSKRGVKTDGAIAYITHYPCINCTKILAASGIKKIFYMNDYKNDENSANILKSVNIEITNIIFE